jgi:hypothetical protein
MANQRKQIELEADLYAAPRKWIFNFRKGEVEYEAYEDGERRLEVKVFGLKLADGSEISLATSQGTVCQIPIAQGQGRIYLSTADGHPLPEVQAGETVEVYYQGKLILDGRLELDD